MSGANKQASAAVAALQAKRRAANKPYLGDDAGGAATLPPSTSAWAVQWKPPSTASRKELQCGSYSPGPCYYPDANAFGIGPHGIGQEYSLRASHRFPTSDKRTTQDEAPGPKYSLTDGFGVQVESNFPSRRSGKFSESKRETTSWLVVDSPGPAQYDPPRTLEKPKERPNGFGASKRDYGLEPDWRPGPGEYQMPTAIGSNMPKRPAGYHPVIRSFAAAGFGQGDRAGTAHMPKAGRDSPGPQYSLRASVGYQVNSLNKSSPHAAFSKAERFPAGSR